MRRMHRALVLTALLALAPGRASAQDAAAAGAVPDAEYLAAVGRGLAAIASGDRAAAATAFREAVQTNPSRPDAVCFLAEVQRAGGDSTGALDGFQACLRVARAASDARWTARAMHGVASTLELMPERAEEARTAWQEYVRFADANTAVASPQVGRSRITSIDQVAELERVTAEVRQRIADRERQRAEEAARPPEPARRGR
jgi:hypothetical protein